VMVAWAAEESARERRIVTLREVEERFGVRYLD